MKIISGTARKKRASITLPIMMRLKKLLLDTDALYFEAMERWCRERFRMPLAKLTRFDSINILSLRQFDDLYPVKKLEDLYPFFGYWGIDPENIPGLTLELGREKGKSAQGICFVLQAPDEIYILMRPEGGWIDLETLWHELGHGFSAAYTSPGSFHGGKGHGHLFQLVGILCLSQSEPHPFPFLSHATTWTSGPPKRQNLYHHKVLKDFSMFRRYAAKFISEYEMFLNGDLSDGEPYARLMRRYTGFYYQPESHLFDLVPELYCLDYILGWTGEAVMESHLRELFGEEWMFAEETGQILKKWWSQGNQYDLPVFLERNGLGKMSMERLVKHWETVLG